MLSLSFIIVFVFVVILVDVTDGHERKARSGGFRCPHLEPVELMNEPGHVMGWRFCKGRNRAEGGRAFDACSPYLASLRVLQ